ncbi:MAG: hypothetical protein F2667_09595 [Actinobacteria bacterium]|uniref:Unannotated protein n=1 Tax=freshwater metagenome TaxID=449393 RepID=A0A6J6R5U3_9ZZZZ|nr:hypothetical protein [Actinomycetota bacterium]
MSDVNGAKPTFLTVPEPARGLERVRLAVPDPLVDTVVGARVWRKRRKPDVVAAARLEMDFLLSEVSTPAEIDAVTQRYLARETYRSELRYHPKIIGEQPVDGVDRLRAARRAGRGVVISFLHHGHYEGATASVGKAEAPIHIAISEDMIGADAPAFLRQHVRVGLRSGNTGVNAAAGAGVLAKVLTDGHVMAIATDVPGRTPLHFLGRDRLGSSGAARLARGTNSLVVVMTAHCDSDGALSLSIGEPIEPLDFASHDELLAELLRAQEPAILAWPEGYHLPRLRWGMPPTDG